MSNSMQPFGQQPTRLLCPQDSLGKNTGVGCHTLLQGIFSIQGSNLGLLNCRQILLHLSHQGSRSSAGKEYACSEGNLSSIPSLEKGKATHSSLLAWRIPWTV